MFAMEKSVELIKAYVAAGFEKSILMPLCPALTTRSRWTQWLNAKRAALLCQQRKTTATDGTKNAI